MKKPLSLFYAIPVLIFQAGASPLAFLALNVETVSQGQIPNGWQIKVNHGHPDVSACSVAEGPCLRLKSVKASFGLERDVDIDPVAMPILHWSWKVKQLPPGGDFRHASTDDQAAQVLVAFADRHVLSYIWDTTAPKGAADNAGFIPLVHVFDYVCESGASSLNQWLAEDRDIASDYRRAYGKPAPRVKGIRIQINSQHTGSVAESYFGAVEFHSANDAALEGRWSLPSAYSSPPTGAPPMILVTGGAGFIGGHVLDRLSDSGQPVRALLRRKINLPANVEPAFGDLAANAGLDQALDGVTAVIHIAGAVKAVRPADYYTGNLTASENLARAAARNGGIPFLHVSSLAACGPCNSEKPVDESTSPAPISDYGKSKLEAEKAVIAHLPNAVIVRPPVVYGPRDRGVFGILESVCRGIVPQIAGGERWFSCILVNDLVDGMLSALRHPAATGRAWFLSNPEPLTWTKLGDLASTIMNRRARIVRVPVPVAYAIGWIGEMAGYLTGKPGFVSREKIREATQRRWVCSPARAAAELGIEARTSHLDGLSRTLVWYKEAGWLKY